MAYVRASERPWIEVSTTHVAEGVVAHHGQVAQRVTRLSPEGGDLLAQAVDVLRQRLSSRRTTRPGLTSKRDDGQRRRADGHRERHHIEDPHAERA